MDISNKLKELRSEKSITQKTLSTTLGVALSVVADIETGRRIPSKNVAIKLASFSNFPVDYWLSEVENEKCLKVRDEFRSTKDAIKVLKDMGHIKNGIPDEKGWEIIKEGIALDLKFMELNEKEQD